MVRGVGEMKDLGTELGKMIGPLNEKLRRRRVGRKRSSTRRRETSKRRLLRRDQAGFGPPESLVSSLGFSDALSSMDFTPPLKFLMAFPSPDPISGRRLAPKIRKTMARMITSSCVPNPNNCFTPLYNYIPVYYGRDILARAINSDCISLLKDGQNKKVFSRLEPGPGEGSFRSAK